MQEGKREGEEKVLMNLPLDQGGSVHSTELSGRARSDPRGLHRCTCRWSRALKSRGPADHLTVPWSLACCFAPKRTVRENDVISSAVHEKFLGLSNLLNLVPVRLSRCFSLKNSNYNNNTDLL